MQNKYCSKCGKILDIEDKASGKCHSCGQSIHKETNKNTVKLYDVYLETIGNDKEKCVALISEFLSISLESAEKKVEHMPLLLLDDGTETQVNELRKRFSELHAKMLIKAHIGTTQQYNSSSKNQSTNTNTVDMENNTSTKNQRKTNKVADIIGVIGIAILVLGVIFSISMLIQKSFAFFVGSLAGFFVTGMLFIGMAEIIQLLDDIKNK